MLMRFKAVHFVVSLCAAALLPGAALAADAASAPSEPEQDPVLATLSIGEIRLSDLREYIRYRPHHQSGVALQGGIQRAVDELVLERMLVAEAKEEGVPLLEGETERSAKFILRAREAFVPKCERVDEDTARGFYDIYQNRFMTPLMVRVSRVMLHQSQQVNGSPAEEYLQTNAVLVKNGLKRFEAVVEDTRPLVPADEKVGDLGFLQLEGEDTELTALLRASKVGDLIGPVPAGEFVLLFEVTGRHEAVVIPYEQVQDRVPDVAFAECMRQADATTRLRLAPKYELEYRRDVIGAIRPN